MTAIDTSVLVRALVDDDRVQSPIARQFLESLTSDVPGFISLTVIAELHWVLSRSLGLPQEEVLDTFDTLLRAMELEIEDGESVGEALEQAKRGAGFADALIDATSRVYGHSDTVTFDRDAARRFGWRLLG